MWVTALNPNSVYRVPDGPHYSASRFSSGALAGLITARYPKQFWRDRKEGAVWTEARLPQTDRRKVDERGRLRRPQGT
jgi:hypothetical protein